MTGQRQTQTSLHPEPQALEFRFPKAPRGQSPRASPWTAPLSSTHCVARDSHPSPLGELSRRQQKRTPFCLHKRTMKFQRRLADSLSIKLWFCKQFVALLCAKLITSALWVSSLQEGHTLREQRHPCLRGPAQQPPPCGRFGRFGGERTCRAGPGMSAAPPAPACAAARSEAGGGERERAAREGQAHSDTRPCPRLHWLSSRHWHRPCPPPHPRRPVCCPTVIFKLSLEHSRSPLQRRQGPHVCSEEACQDRGTGPPTPPATRSQSSSTQKPRDEHKQGPSCQARATNKAKTNLQRNEVEGDTRQVLGVPPSDAETAQHNTTTMNRRLVGKEHLPRSLLQSTVP